MTDCKEARQVEGFLRNKNRNLPVSSGRYVFGTASESARGGATFGVWDTICDSGTNSGARRSSGIPVWVRAVCRTGRVEHLLERATYFAGEIK